MTKFKEQKEEENERKRRRADVINSD